MSEAELLLLIVTCVYLVECARWWRHDAVLFVSRDGVRFVPRWASARLGNQTGGLAWAWPLPPLGVQFSCHTMPLAVSPLGVYATHVEQLSPNARATSTNVARRWDAIRSVNRFGSDVFLDQTRLAHFRSDAAARFWTDWLTELQRKSPEKRESMIVEQLRQSLDSERVRERLELYRTATRSIRRVGNLLWMLIAVSGPALVWLDGFWMHWPWLLGGLVTLVLCQSFLYQRAHRRLYPLARWQRLGHALIVIISPLSAIRAHDWLAHDLLLTQHPLAVARVLLAEREFHEFTRRVWLDLRYPLTDEIDVADQAIDPGAMVVWFRQQWLQLVEERLRAWQVMVTDLETPPVRESDETLGYCPRCHDPVTLIETNCPRCIGVAVVPWVRASEHAS